MYVRVNVARRVKVYHCFDGFYVQAARCHVCRDQQVVLAALECVKHLHAAELLGWCVFGGEG